MTEITPELMDRVELAIRSIRDEDDQFLCTDGTPNLRKIACHVRAELTRKQEFRDGEVVIRISPDGSPPRPIYIQGDFYDPTEVCRPLRLSEMPKAVEDLREAVVSVTGPNYQDNNRSRVLTQALQVFDSKIEP